MDLTHVKGIGPAKQKKLQDAGITSVQELAKADAAQLAKKTGYSEATLKEYQQRATALVLLEDVKGVGPATVAALAEQGVRSLKEFYEASSDRLAAELQVAKGKVQVWQKEAERLAKRVAADAKTPAGRKRLAQEGKALAQETSKKAQVVAQKALKEAKVAGDLTVKKARELQEKAPVVLKEAREKVETGYKQAESKLKAEAEKMRAANEGLIGRLKARFARQG